jgi:hypothetical protein
VIGANCPEWMLTMQGCNRTRCAGTQCTALLATVLHRCSCSSGSAGCAPRMPQGAGYHLCRCTCVTAVLLQHCDWLAGVVVCLCACSMQCVPLYDTLGENAIDFILNNA